MDSRQSIRNNQLGYTDKEILLAVNMIKELSDAIDLMFYLMNRNKENTFVLILITAKDADLKEILLREKRNTDIVYDVYSEENVYAILCQETKVDGGYRFVERIIDKIQDVKGKEIYCSKIEVRTTMYPSKDIIFRVLDSFVKARKSGKSGEIIFKSIS
jgi:hypothetical protein